MHHAIVYDFFVSGTVHKGRISCWLCHKCAKQLWQNAVTEHT